MIKSKFLIDPPLLSISAFQIVSELFRKCLVHIVGDQPALPIGKLEDLFQQIRACEEKLFIGHQEDCFD